MADRPVASFGGLLRRLRAEAGLTQEELAGAAGLSTRSVSDLERGVNLTARRDTARLLADALGLSGSARAGFEQAARGRLPDGPVAWAGPAGGDLAGWSRPRQLPAAPPHFTGRSAELARLSRLACDAASAMMIAVISGTAGVGKTALAIRFAHQVAPRFPDGQLHVNLRGFGPGGQGTDRGEAVGGFLDALGVSALGRPVSVEAQAALFRSLVAGRRMLIVLDNARDSDQVRPLLPGESGCLVLVTSRSPLGGLVADHGACLVSLDLLAPAEARAMLAARLGGDEVAAEPAAADAIIAACAGLPLALAIVAARAAARRGASLPAIAGELGDARSRLDALAGGEAAVDVRAVLSWSYQALGPEAARLFRLLGLHPGPDISAPAAASLAGLPLPATRLLLAELTRANLAGEPAPGRYASHDLLRAYAAELAGSQDGAAWRAEAIGRLLDHYVHTGCAANLVLFPYWGAISLRPPRPGTSPESFAGRWQAQAWLTTERSVLLAAITHAAAAGYDTLAWQLAWPVGRILRYQGRWHEQAAVGRIAVAAAARLADPVAQAHSHLSLGVACTFLGSLDDARAHLRYALDLYRQAGDRLGQARARAQFGFLSSELGRHAEAQAHNRKALALYQAAGNQHGQARMLNNIGYVYALLGEHRLALARCQRALSMQQELDDQIEIANTWHNLGYAHHHLGNYQQAADSYQHAIDLYRDIGNAPLEGMDLCDLGDTYHAAGDPTAARQAWQQALAILDRLADPDAAIVRDKLAESPDARTADRAARHNPRSGRRLGRLPVPRPPRPPGG